MAFVSISPLVTQLPRSINVCKTSYMPQFKVRTTRRYGATLSTSSVRMSVEETPSAVTVASTPPLQKPPAGAFEAAASLGAMKGKSPAWKVLLLGIIAGAYIGVGGFLALRVGGAMPGIAAANPGLQRLLLGLVGLPTGLLMVLSTGGELFTGNTMLLSAAVLTGRVGMGGLAKNWIFSFIGNFIGSLLVVKLVCATGVFAAVGSGSAAAVAAAVAKTSLTFGQAFWRGVFCNWLVCLAVYMANAASDLPGKFTAVILPISAFVAMGMEHSIANMFFVPMGMKLGADVGIKSLLMKNLLPVTLGNIVAGVLFVAVVYFLAFGKKQSM